jgi:hypothetical protein
MFGWDYVSAEIGDQGNIWMKLKFGGWNEKVL